MAKTNSSVFNKLKQKVASHNAAVVANFNNQLADQLNGVVLFNRQKKAELARDAYEEIAIAVFKQVLTQLKRNYRKHWDMAIYRSDKTASSNSWAPLSEPWQNAKYKAIRDRNKVTKKQKKKIFITNRKTNMGRTFFHGLGSLGLPIHTSLAPLKAWVAQISPNVDAKKIYRLLGEAQLVATGGVFRSGVTVNAKGTKVMRNGKPITLRNAVKQSSRLRASVAKHKDLRIFVDKTGLLQAYTSDKKRISILELNQSQLIGSHLKLTAFNHYYKSSIVNANKGIKNTGVRLKNSHKNEHFFLQALRDPSNNIFNASASYKLGYSSKQGLGQSRTPIQNILTRAIANDMSLQLKARMQK